MRNLDAAELSTDANWVTISSTPDPSPSFTTPASQRRITTVEDVSQRRTRSWGWIVEALKGVVGRLAAAGVGFNRHHGLGRRGGGPGLGLPSGGWDRSPGPAARDKHDMLAAMHIVEGADTVPFRAGDFGPTLDAVEDFLTGRRESARTERVLATVLFTDIVGSTSRASQMGDQRWLDLMGDHDRIVRSQIERYRGRVIKMTGDGAIATFDGPARAIACAVAITEMVSKLGLPVRAGIHTGEVQMRDGDAHGLGMHIASRVMDHAKKGGIVVSSTVKDLVVGSGIEFQPCGVVQLKGLPESWHLFEVTSLHPHF